MKATLEGVHKSRVKAIRDEDECGRATGSKCLPETIFLHQEKMLPPTVQNLTVS